MSVVTVENEALNRLLPYDEEEWTVDDLARMPNDGFRYELFDGVLVVSPAPFGPHQLAVVGLLIALRSACPPHLAVIVAPFDFQPTGNRSFQPDLLVVARSDIPESKPLKAPPLVTVEVLSKGTRTLDRSFKRDMYAASGVDHYWLFDPRALEFVALERQGARYREVARAAGDDRIVVDMPYRVEICPAEIAAG